MNLLSEDTKEIEPQAIKVWFDDDNSSINVELSDGRLISVPVSFYPLLAESIQGRERRL